MAETVVVDRAGVSKAVVEGVGACCLGSLRLDSILCWWMDGPPGLASVDVESTVE